MLSIVQLISFLSFTIAPADVLLNVVPVGTTSFTVMFVTGSSPRLFTLIVYLILSPAVTLPSGSSSSVYLITSAVFS